MWPFKSKPNLPFTNAVVNELLNGPVTYIDIQKAGISEIKVTVNGVSVSVSWYSTGSRRDIVIGGQNCVANSGPDASAIYEAAHTRADNYFNEKIIELSKKMGITTEV